MTSIEGKVAVVTGAGRGIGRAIALELARMGARVALVAQNASQLEQTASCSGNASVISGGCSKERRCATGFWIRCRRLSVPSISWSTPPASACSDSVTEFSDCRLRRDSRHEPAKHFHGLPLCSAVDDRAAEGRHRQYRVHCRESRIGDARRLLRVQVRRCRFLRSRWLKKSASMEFASASSVRAPPIRRFRPIPIAKGRPAERCSRPSDVAHAVRMLVTQEPNSFISEIILRPKPRSHENCWT